VKKLVKTPIISQKQTKNFTAKTTKLTKKKRVKQVPNANPKSKTQNSQELSKTASNWLRLWPSPQTPKPNT